MSAPAAVLFEIEPSLLPTNPLCAAAVAAKIKRQPPTQERGIP